jgi:large subunit ribosomal protein L14e
MFDVGRVCVKLAGRDAGQKCVIVEKLEGKYVVVDGMTRRRKCNTLHLEPLEQTIEVGNGSHENVVNAFRELGLEIKATTKKAKTAKPKTAKKAKAVEEKAKTKAKKEKKVKSKAEKLKKADKK